MTEEIIIDGVNVAGCEYISDIDCSCIFVKNYYGTTTNPRCSQVKNCHYKQLKRLEQELKWANDEEKYLKDCCIKAGKELEKHSFKWDGKEKNLVVQALQLNQLYEKLEQENKDLKKQIESDKGLITVGGKQQYDMTMAYDKCKTALEEIREVIYYCGYKDVVDKVLPKINECLGE